MGNVTDNLIFLNVFLSYLSVFGVVNVCVSARVVNVVCSFNETKYPRRVCV